MWKGSVLVAALAVALTAIAGVAVASVGSSDDTALTGDDVAATLAALTDDAAEQEASTTTTSTVAPAADDNSSMSDTASMSDDEDGDDSDSESMSGTTTTTTMGDLDDDYSDDDDDDYSDDDDEYVMVADGVYPIDASPYGSVTVEVRDGMLYLASIDIDPVWMLHEREEKSDEVELEFYWGESELKIKVEVDDGQLKKMVEFDMKEDDDDYDDDYSDDDDEYVMIADGVYPIDASPYGGVTVEVRDGMLYLTSIDIDSVWVLHEREEKSDEVELEFYWGESELKIKVEVDDGQLKKMVEFDLK